MMMMVKMMMMRRDVAERHVKLVLGRCGRRGLLRSAISQLLEVTLDLVVVFQNYRGHC
jgi:hypothetical protein